jgi:RNA polymerase sigma factor (sigma-70 family)
MPSAENPFKQRWYYDPEQEYAMRLPRGGKAEELHRMNEAELKARDRAIADEYACREWRKSCDGRSCVSCPNRERIVCSLDKPIVGSGDGDGEETLADVLSDEMNLFDAQMDSAVLLDAIKELAPDQQELIRLRFFEDKSTAEIAAAMGIKTHGQISRRLETAMKRLREILKNVF